MESNSILSFSTPLSEAERVEVLPSPVLELAYASYILGRDDPFGRPDRPSWLVALKTEQGELTRRLRAFWPDAEGEHAGSDLLMMAGEFSYSRDPDPERFLDDLPTLPERLLEQLRIRLGEAEPSAHLGKCDDLIGRLERLSGSAERSAQLQTLLRDLWRALGPGWRQDGLATVEAACETFRQQYRATGDVLAALPAHHFVQFEASANKIRASKEKGRVLVVPLYFASGGGFDLDLQSGHFIGFGLNSETMFEQTAGRIAELAGRIKAFADPTRLMLMTMIARYRNMSLTVGDLARQLGVSQPTVSGHLKLLKEAGLVKLDRQGNKAYYQIDDAAVRAVLGELEDAVLNP